jgi:hypothetical protein
MAILYLIRYNIASETFSLKAIFNSGYFPVTHPGRTMCQEWLPARGQQLINAKTPRHSAAKPQPKRRRRIQHGKAKVVRAMMVRGIFLKTLLSIPLTIIPLASDFSG